MNARTITSRLLIGNTVTAVLLLVVAGLVLFNTNRVRQDAYLIRNDAVPGSIDAHIIRNALARDFRNSILAAATSSPVKMEKYISELTEQRQTVEAALKHYSETMFIDAAVDRENVARFRTLYQKYSETRDRMLDLRRAGKREEAIDFIEKTLRPESSKLAEMSDRLVAYNHHNADSLSAAIIQSTDTVRLTVSVSTVVASLGALLLAWHLVARRREEKEYRLQTHRFATAARVARMALWVRDFNRGTVEWSDALDSVVGAGSDQYARSIVDWLALVHPDDLPRLNSAIGASRTQGAAFESEYRLKRLDGEYVWVRDTGNFPIAGQNSGVMYGAIRDINEHKLVQESLKAADERLMLALQASRLGIWERNFRTGLVEWDARTFEIFGREYRSPGPSREESDSWLVPEDLPALQAVRRRIQTGENSIDVHFRILRPDGEVRHLSAQVVVRRDDSGRPVSALVVNADVTDIVRATEESSRLREKLRQAQKMETLGTLAAGVAHDFNNLLTGINGFVELGASTLPPDHEAVEMLRQARHGAASARDLVRRILDFSRRAPDAERSVVQLADFVRSSAPLITAGLPDQVSLSFAMDEDAPRVQADPTQIQQVLMNLCVNGAHAIGDKGGTITIGLRLETVAESGAGDATARPIVPGRYACLSVSDTGCGMNPEVRARIFEAFYTTKAAGIGTGLGLSVVQDIVADHNGFIRVRSELGRGTTFEVLLPAAGEIAAKATGARPDPAVRGRGERILVVDDEPSIAAVVQRALTIAGYSPEVFSSAVEAWQKFAAAPDRYDLLLIDNQMPELTGAEFASRARQLSGGLPIVVMTGRVDAAQPEVLRKLGGVEVLMKPFVIEELLGQVASALRAQSVTPRH